MEMEAWTLGAIGLAKGVYEVYIRPNPSKVAWATIGGFALAFDIFAPEGQTLSEGVDKALESHKVLTTLAVGATALHLLNKLPAKIDPFVMSNNRLRA